MTGASGRARGRAVRCPQLDALRLYRKSTAVSYILSIALSWLSAYRFYLKRPVTACVLIELSLVTYLASAVDHPFSLIGLIVLAWLFVDLVLVNGMIRSHSREVRARVLHGTLR